MSNSLRPHRLQPARLLCPWNFPRQEYWSGLPCLPPRISSSQGSNLCLLTWRRILYHWATGEACLPSCLTSKWNKVNVVLSLLSQKPIICISHQVAEEGGGLFCPPSSSLSKAYIHECQHHRWKPGLPPDPLWPGDLATLPLNHTFFPEFSPSPPPALGWKNK